MSLINVLDVKVLNNPAPFLSEFSFEVTFECVPPGVREDVEWKLIYVGNAYDEALDQELDSVLVGPIALGKNKFIFTAPCPDHTLIASEDLMELTALLLCGYYRNEEFIRIGYYVNNEYPESETALRAEWQTAIQREEDRVQRKRTAAANGEKLSEAAIPKPRVIAEKLWRNIAANEPRVTRSSNAWDSALNENKTFEMSESDRAVAAGQENIGLVDLNQSKPAPTLTKPVHANGTEAKSSADDDVVDVEDEELDDDDDDDDDDSDDGDVDLEQESGAEVEGDDDADEVEEILEQTAPDASVTSHTSATAEIMQH